MHIRLYADASVDSSHGGWAAWADLGSGYLRNGGPLPDRTKSVQAELDALLRGLRMVLDGTCAGRGDRLIARSDCEQAVKILMAGLRRETVPAWAQASIDPVRREIATRGLWVECYHTKGHTGGTSISAVVNAWCDAMANWHRLTSKKNEMFSLAQSKLRQLETIPQ